MTRHTISLKDQQVTLSPAWLRKHAANPDAVILVAASRLAMLADAIEIADEAAEAHIDSETLSVDEDGLSWRDLNTVDPTFKDSVDESLRYLEARALLIRHPARAGLVRIQELPQ